MVWGFVSSVFRIEPGALCTVLATCLCAVTRHLTEVSQGRKVWFPLTIPGQAWRQLQKLPGHFGLTFRKQNSECHAQLALDFSTTEPQPKDWNYSQLGWGFTLHRKAQISVSMVILNFIKMTMMELPLGAMQVLYHWAQTPPKTPLYVSGLDLLIRMRKIN